MKKEMEKGMRDDSGNRKGEDREDMEVREGGGGTGTRGRGGNKG